MPFTRHRIPRVRIDAPRIHQPHTIWWILFSLALLVIAAMLGWRLYALGGERAGYDRDRATGVIDQLQDQLDKVSSERDHYRQQAIMLERSAQIEEEAARNLRAELLMEQSANLQAREEAELLKKLVSDNTIDSGLRINDFAIVEADEPNTYDYEAVVTRLPASDKEIKATLAYTVAGIESGEERTYAIEDVDLIAPKGHVLTFKQIERINGSFELPEAFHAQKIVVTLTTKEAKVSDADPRDFLWRLGPRW